VAEAGGAIPWKTGPFQLCGTDSELCAGQIWKVKMKYQAKNYNAKINNIQGTLKEREVSVQLTFSLSYLV
jgi:hypothetical protein